MPDPGEVIAFLSEGRALGLPDLPVERIDTHAAIIFLIGDRAYKLKRAILYSFLAFSTLAKRHRILEAEYRLNVRTAPDLYRRLTPVTRDDAGRLALEGEGEIVDWLLEMRRFDQVTLLDHLAEHGRLDAPLIRTLASEIVSLHEKAEVRHGCRPCLDDVDRRGQCRRSRREPSGRGVDQSDQERAFTLS